MYNFDKKISRKGTNSLKWETGGHGQVQFKKNSLSFSVADMDLAIAPNIEKAIKNRVNKKIIGYTAVRTPEFFGAVGGFFKRHFDWEIAPNQIFTVIGVMDGIMEAMMKMTKMGEGVIIQQPVYSPFTFCVRAVRRNLVVNELVNNDGHYTIDFDLLEKQASDPANTMMLFCSPHNPVGRVWTQEELEKVADICQRNNVILVSDEIHCDLTRIGVKHIPVAKLRPENDIITLVSTAKSFNIAGLKIANVIFNNDKMKTMYKPRTMAQHENPLSIAAMISAYTECDEWLLEVRKYIDSNLTKMQEWLTVNLPKVKFNIPEGSYLTWLNVSAYTNDTNEFANQCGKQGIIIEQGDAFGAGGAGFIRINAATPWSILEEGLKRLKKTVEKHAI